jgi:hypothetical protein
MVPRSANQTWRGSRTYSTTAARTGHDPLFNTRVAGASARRTPRRDAIGQVHMRVATPVSRLAKARGQAYAALDRARSSAASACRDLVCRRRVCRSRVGGGTVSCTRGPATIGPRHDDNGRRFAEVAAPPIPHDHEYAIGTVRLANINANGVQPPHDGHGHSHDSNSSREALTPATCAFKHCKVGRTVTCSATF